VHFKFVIKKHTACLDISIDEMKTSERNNKTCTNGVMIINKSKELQQFAGIQNCIVKTM